MHKAIIILMLSIANGICSGQNKPGAEQLVDEGIVYHDKGEFDLAISKYDKALEADENNLRALIEKAYSLSSLHHYEESIKWCQKAIETHPNKEGLETLYVTYGSALDALKQTDKSIEVFDEGIRLFPDYYQLYYNKGITLSVAQRYGDAILAFQKAVILNPKHASSHNAIARLSQASDKRIPSILAYCRFLSLEQQSARAKENLSNLQRLMKANVKETGKKSVTITISSDLLSDSTSGRKPKENNFNTADLILTMAAGLDFDKQNKNAIEADQFIRKLDALCSSLGETQQGNYGFFWEYYAPYFIDMKNKGLVQTFGYLSFLPSESPIVLEWVKSHHDELEKFLNWSTAFRWKTDR